MAHIVFRPAPDGPPAFEVIINGHDFSNEIYHGVELVEVGEGEFAEVGFRCTFVVSRLDIGGDDDIEVTGHMRSVAQRVHAAQQEAVSA